ncbi:hypothetical protein GCM10010266_05640 [Streptomyces griseomycini]|nr:hypothetical protein GCM10010266_05640 [Streptomyces griseomycini]
MESVGWRSIFWTNLPVGLAALLLTLRFVPESRTPRARRPDPVGRLPDIVLSGSLTYAITEAPHAGLPTAAPFAGLALAVLVVGAATSGRWARGTAERTAERLEPAEPHRPAGSGRAALTRCRIPARTPPVDPVLAAHSLSSPNRGTRTATP